MLSSCGRYSLQKAHSLLLSPFPITGCTESSRYCFCLSVNSGQLCNLSRSNTLLCVSLLGSLCIACYLRPIQNLFLPCTGKVSPISHHLAWQRLLLLSVVHAFSERVPKDVSDFISMKDSRPGGPGWMYCAMIEEIHEHSENKNLKMMTKTICPTCV